MEEGFFAEKVILVFAFVAMLAFVTAPLIMAVVTITATVTNQAPTIGRIRICDGTCAVTKTSIDPPIWFTLEVNVSDPNSWRDINTQSFRVTLYHNTDANSCGEDWDCNALYLNVKDNNLMLATANGCTQSNVGTTAVFCINIPVSTWSTKFLWGDVNVYVAVDDNGGASDMNAVDRNAFVINKLDGTTEDISAGTYSGNPGTDNVVFSGSPGSNPYVELTHNGNNPIDLNIRGSDLNVSAVVFIGDGNQSWNLNVSDSADSNSMYWDENAAVDWNRGTSPNSSKNRVFYWLDIPLEQPGGDYTGTTTHTTAIRGS